MNLQQRTTKAHRVANVVKHFDDLKTANPDSKWWSEFVRINWKPRVSVNKNPAAQAVSWYSITYRPNLNTEFTPLQVGIMNEKHIGQLAPKILDEADKTSGKTERLYKPCIQIQKWTEPLILEPNSLVVKEQPNETNNRKSVYFQFIEYMEEIISKELEEKIDRGRKFKDLIKKKPDTIDSLEEVKKALGHTAFGDTIMENSDLQTLIKTFPKTMDATKFNNEIIRVETAKVHLFIQRSISAKSPTNPMGQLPNPITRIVIPFDQATEQLNRLVIYDKQKSERVGNTFSFPEFLINGEKVNDRNVHQVFTSRTIIDGIVNLDSICVSRVGISVPIKASRALFIDRYVRESIDPNDVMSEIRGDDFNPVDPNIYSNIDDMCEAH